MQGYPKGCLKSDEKGETSLFRLEGSRITRRNSEKDALAQLLNSCACLVIDSTYRVLASASSKSPAIARS